ncbi:MAG TPA: hypothetical protein VEB03_01960 [Candidatus Nanoarchaeia archaeon]|nr:hypothetical protein [Candidatus Nanoarchaeia archaeon]
MEQQQQGQHDEDETVINATPGPDPRAVPGPIQTEDFLINGN